jgi:Domain of unknown function (DUF397)
MHAFSVVHDQEGGSVPSWRKSTRSAHNGNCVEVARFPGRVVAVRDSKNPTGAPIAFAAQDWARFVANLKNG